MLRCLPKCICYFRILDLSDISATSAAGKKLRRRRHKRWYKKRKPLDYYVPEGADYYEGVTTLQCYYVYGFFVCKNEVSVYRKTRRLSSHELTKQRTFISCL